MGIFQSLSWTSMWTVMSRREIKGCVLGLDSAGKTQLGNFLTALEKKETVPTIGFHVASFTYKNISLNCFDVGGQKVLRNLWKHFYAGSDIIIYVVDSNDRDRIKESAAELHQCLENVELAKATLLIYANKQDLPNAVSVAELYKLMKVDELRAMNPKRKIHVQGCCALDGKGLYEGLDFLCSNLPAEQ